MKISVVMFALLMGMYDNVNHINGSHNEIPINSSKTDVVINDIVLL